MYYSELYTDRQSSYLLPTIARRSYFTTFKTAVKHKSSRGYVKHAEPHKRVDMDECYIVLGWRDKARVTQLSGSRSPGLRFAPSSQQIQEASVALSVWDDS